MVLVCSSRPSSATESKSSDHFHQAGSELLQNTEHELHAYHPRILDSPAAYSRSLQNLCMHITSAPQPYTSTSAPPTAGRAHVMAGGRIASPSSLVCSGSRDGAFNSDGACVTGIQVSVPSARAHPVEDKNEGSSLRSKRGQRCWSAGAADRSARHVKQTLIRRPTSATHPTVVPTAPEAMRLQPQIVRMHGGSQLHAHYEAAKVCFACMCSILSGLPLPDCR